MLALSVGIALYAATQVALPLRGLHSNDFKHIYLGMQALTEGSEPYTAESLLLQAHRHGLGNAALNPYVYLPFTGLCLGFLKPLPFPAAAHAWFWLNHLMAIGAVWIVSRSLFRFRADREQWAGHALGLLLIALALSYPLLRTLTAGQLNCVLLLCLAGAYLALASGRDALAGAILGFAAVFKLAPGLFLLYFLLRRRWRALGAMTAVCAALLAVSLLAVGWSVHLDFLPMLSQMSYGRSTWQEHGATFWKDPANQSLNSFFTHLVVSGNGLTDPWVEWGQTAANRMTALTTLALVAAYVIAALRRDPARQEAGRDSLTDQDSAVYMATILLSLLVPSLMWDHYLVLLILPTAWLARTLAGARCPGWAVLVVVLYALTAVPWRHDSPRFQFGGGVPLMSMKLFPTLALYAVCLGTKRLLSRGTPSIRGGADRTDMEGLAE
jgi:hypothetical protein